MGIGDALKKMAFKPEDEPELPPIAPKAGFPRAATYKRGEPTIGPLRVRSTPVRGTATVYGTSPDPEMAQDIETVLMACRAAGYVELTKQLDVLAAAIPDETARTAAALASVQAMLGLSSQQVRTAVQERIDALKKHSADFSAGLESEIHATKAQNEQHLTTVRARIGEISAELVKLQADEQDTAKALDEIANKSAEVASKFDATLQPYFDELNGLISKIR